MVVSRVFVLRVNCWYTAVVGALVPTVNTSEGEHMIG